GTARRDDASMQQNIATPRLSTAQERRRPHHRGSGTTVRHRSQRAGWLRAAVLGANDGIVSVASVAIGVIAAGASTSFVLTAAIAGPGAGARAKAAGGGAAG